MALLTQTCPAPPPGFAAAVLLAAGAAVDGVAPAGAVAVAEEVSAAALSLQLATPLCPLHAPDREVPENEVPSLHVALTVAAWDAATGANRSPAPSKVPNNTEFITETPIDRVEVSAAGGIVGKSKRPAADRGRDHD